MNIMNIMNIKDVAVDGIGTTIGCVAGAVILTGLSYALFEEPSIAAVSFGIGAIGGGLAGWKICDMEIGEHDNPSYTISNTNKSIGTVTHNSETKLLEEPNNVK